MASSCRPRSRPRIGDRLTVTPSPHRPIGAKGVGESPNVGGVRRFPTPSTTLLVPRLHPHPDAARLLAHWRTAKELERWRRSGRWLHPSRRTLARAPQDKVSNPHREERVSASRTTRPRSGNEGSRTDRASVGGQRLHCRRRAFDRGLADANCSGVRCCWKARRASARPKWRRRWRPCTTPN